jgi:hypothetical protein
MKRRKKVLKPARANKSARRKELPMFSSDLLVVRTSPIKARKPATLKKRDSASALTRKIGHALAKPGISPSVIFRDSQAGQFAYSVDPANPKQIVRRSRSGTIRALRSSLPKTS